MNLELLLQRIDRFRRRGILIDANLLLLYFVGARRPDLIRAFKRTAAYTADDFALLRALIARFRRITTTPHVLTEVSNLMGQCGEPMRSDLRHWLARAVQAWEEERAPSRTLAQTAGFPRFGLTDAAIAEVAARACLVLTDDHPLAGWLEARGAEVIRFSELQATCL
jgi:hypothetical protein